MPPLPSGLNLGQTILQTMNKKVLIMARPAMAAEFLAAFLEQSFRGSTFIRSASLSEARGLLHCQRLDLVLMDVQGYERAVISLLREIADMSPHTRCLILSAEVNPSWVNQALRAGARGFMTKSCDSMEVLRAVDAVSRGETHLSADVMDGLAGFIGRASKGSLHGALSPRELEIFIKIGQGKSLKKISEELALSAITVSVHKFHIGKKTGIKATAKIARYCIEQGLLHSAA